MKLLFDQNISYRLVQRLGDLDIELAHVKNLGLENASDKTIWNYAKENHFSIVTFDIDFFDYSLVWGFPPKIIHLRTLNQTSKNLELLIRQHQGNIAAFHADSEMACLEIIEKAV